MADNGTAAAQAKGEAAAASAPTAPQPSDADVQSGTAKSSSTPTEPQVTAGSIADAEPVGDVVVAAPSTVASADAVDVHPDATGGQSFDYGFKDDTTRKGSKVEQNAQAIADYDARVRQENPDMIVYRKAGSAGKVGGESFDYGQKPKTD